MNDTPPDMTGAPEPEPPVEVHGDAEKKRNTQTDKLIEIALQIATEYFHDAEVAYATVKVGGKLQTIAVKRSAFRKLLSHLYYVAVGKVPNADSLGATINALEGRGIFEGKQRKVFVRVGSDDSGAVYIDMGDDTFRVIKVTAAGWEIIEADPCPVRFRRSEKMLPLAKPEQIPLSQVPQTLAELKFLLNTDSQSDLCLYVAWLIGAYHPTGPYPIIMITGLAGSAKSNKLLVLRRLTDPNSVPTRAEPKESRDLAIAANNAWDVMFDNVSHLPSALQDMLCRLATGGGFGIREMYTDEDEKIWESKRPVGIGAITEVATHGDMLSRTIGIDSREIDRKRRITEKKFWKRFNAIESKLLGALLTCVSAALRNYDAMEVELEGKLPRMADFTVFVAGGMATAGFGAQEFLDHYNQNHQRTNEITLDASFIGAIIPKILKDFGGSWEGTAQELLTQLHCHAESFDLKKQTGFPHVPKAASDALRRITENLRGVGIEVIFHPRTMDARKITIRWASPNISTQQGEPEPEEPQHTGNDFDEYGNN